MKIFSRVFKPIKSTYESIVGFVRNSLFKGISKGIDRFLVLANNSSFQKSLMIVAFFSMAFIKAFAAGEDGFTQATSTIAGYQDLVSSLMKAIGAIIAIVGAFNVFYKMQNGDQDVKKTIMLTLGGCIAFVALGEALPAFFK